MTDAQPMTNAQRQAVGYALKLIQQRDHTLAELSEKLSRRCEEAEKEFALAFVNQYRLINDERTAKGTVARNVGRRAVGDDLLREKLRNKGVPEEIIELAFMVQEQTELERANDVVRLKFPKGATRTKVARYLGSKGFSEETVESIFESLPEDSEIEWA